MEKTHSRPTGNMIIEIDGRIHDGTEITNSL